MSTRDWLKFLFISLIWGSSFFWIKIAVQEMPVITLVMLRILISLIVTGLAVFTQKYSLNLRAFLPHLVVIGLVNVILPFLLIAWSEKEISSGVAAIINSTQPLFTLIIASLVFHEELITRNKIIGLVLGFSGVVILVSDQLSIQSTQYQAGLFTMLLATLCYAAGTVYVRSKLNALPSPVQVLGQMITALIMITPMAFVFDSPIKLPELPITWIAVFYLGLLVSGVGNLLFFSLIKSVGPTRSTLTIYALPLVAISLGVLILNEKFEWRMGAGAAMIIAGIAIVNSRLQARDLLLKFVNQLTTIFRV